MTACKRLVFNEDYHSFSDKGGQRPLKILGEF